jgi:hypothetical protein
MKANEKAEELIIKMYYCNRYDDKEDYIPAMAYERAKQCALMAVNELLNDCNVSSPFEEVRIKYWQEVKKEIEKL